MGSSPEETLVADSKEEALRRSREAAEMAIIVEVGRLIGSTLEIDEVYERFAVEVRKLIPFDRIIVTQINPDGKSFTLSYVFGLDLPLRRKGDTYPLAGSTTEELIRTQTGLLLNPETEKEYWDRFPGTTGFRMGVRSLISVPLISRDEVIGALHFRSLKSNAYSEQDLRLAERIGRQIAGAIANARLYADLDRLAKEVAMIAEVGRLIGSTLEIDEVYERFAAEVRKLIPFDRINVNLKNPDGQTFTVAYVAGLESLGMKKGDTRPLAGSITEELIRTRTSLVMHLEKETEVSDRFPGTTTFRLGLRSLMSVPLISRDQVIGVLHFRSLSPNAYREEDLLLAERIGRQIAGAVDNARLFADQDRLAGEMAVIAEVGRLIGSTLEIDEVYERFAAEVRKLIPFDRINVNLKSPDGEAFTIAYVSGLDIAGRRKGDKVPLAGSMTEAIFETRTGLVLHPETERDIFDNFPNSSLSPSVSTTFRLGVRSLMAVPLISRDEVIGVLHFRAIASNLYSEQDLRLAERIGRQIAGAIANAQLFQELQNTEVSLRESRMRFQAIFEQAAVGVAEMEIATGRFLMVNRRLCGLVGRTEEELLALTFMEITHPDDLSLHLEDMARLEAGELANFTLEKRYLHKDGSASWVSVTLSPLWKPGEPLTRNIIVVQDIAERRRIALELDHHSKRLVALNETVGELASELRLDTLLQSIVERALALIGGATCQCYLHRPETDLLERVSHTGDAVFTGRPLRQSDEGFVGHVWSMRAPFLIDDYLAWPGRVREFDSLPPRTLLGVPIQWGDQLLGVLVVIAYLPHRYAQKDAEVLGMFARQAAIALRNAQLYDRMNREISDRRQAEENLQETLDALESRVRERTIELEETNTALRVLIKKGEADQKKLEESLQSNVNQLVTPFLSKLRVSRSDKERLTYLNILEENLNNVVSPFINRLSAVYRNLTPKEIQIAEMVKQGKRSKEIADSFGVAVGTVITHRNNIRKKLHLKSRNANLRSYLLSLM